MAWLRRRALHRRLAEALEAAGGQSIEVATHWLGAREPGRARDALVQATAEFEALYAYRDVAGAARQALDLWPEEETGPARAELLERYARCAQLAGELAEAAKAWRELSAIHVAAGEQVPLAEAQRQLAAVHELKGERELAFTVRLSAAQAFEANGRPADAAVERLAMANHRRFGARYGEAIQLAQAAGADAARAERVDLRARALGLEGLARAMGGDAGRGLDTVRTGLALALEHDLTAVAAELYQRLGMVLYDSSDYRRSRDALDTALGLCRSNGDESSEAACATCLMWVLRERGEWARAIALGRELTAAGTSVWVVEGVIGVIHALPRQVRLGAADDLLLPGDLDAARPLPHVAGLDDRARLRVRGRRLAGRGRRALPPAARALGGERGPPLRRLAARVVGRLARRTRRPRRRARLRRGAHRASRPTPPTRTRSPGSRTRSASWRCSTATPRRPPSSSRAPSRSTAASTFPSSARTWSCGRAWRSPRWVSASRRSSA